MSFRIPLGLGISLKTLPRAHPRQPYFFHSFTTNARPSNSTINPIRFPLRSITTSSTQRTLPPSCVLASLQQSSERSTLSLLRRTFTSTRPNSLRQTYFPRSSGGSGGRPRAPFWRVWKAFLDGLPPIFVIYGLMVANVGIFLLWQYAYQSYTRFRDPTLLNFMLKNFVLSEANMMGGRIWTLITSAFSHSAGNHIFVNLLGLYFIAPAAAGLIGSSAFLGLYLAGGVISSLTSLLWHRGRGEQWGGSEGASGAIYSTLSFWGALNPNSTILLFFIIPMPVWVFVTGLFAYDLFGSIAKPNSGTDSAGHIGGLLAGLAMAYRWRRGRMGGFGRRY